jgi:hypothetical protein
LDLKVHRVSMEVPET